MSDALGPAYRYRATLVRVIDGDTYELRVDLGFKVYAEIPIRLYGWNCPETNTVEGHLAATVVSTILGKGLPIVIESYRGHQTFARWLATVWVGGENLGEILERNGVATRTGPHGLLDAEQE